MPGISGPGDPSCHHSYELGCCCFACVVTMAASRCSVAITAVLLWKAVLMSYLKKQLQHLQSQSL